MEKLRVIRRLEVKMKLLEDVKLNEELEELAQRGIHKGYDGTIAKVIESCQIVIFPKKKQKLLVGNRF